MASTCCPIEMEPRTLRQGQLIHAREVAEDVIQKMEPNKATSIFTEGLKLTNPTKDAGRSAEHGEEVGGEPIESQKQRAECIEKPCQCSCASGLGESPDQPELKEPVSAPF
ncbi:uncharacterized protein LOC115738049 [Rhodamnia argentea]|uniref:Uncharacterized protein LOC115738049 n=1 Tax=Rhodamnia argentea TaxID=178133 RepID=A0A8B8NV46_9MYRT|nr:uncharacterized protein LOC115738049 [Rhodamnia argentea]